MQKRQTRTIPRSAQEGEHKLHNSIVAFLLLFIFWVIFSGHFDTYHLTLGVICSLLVARFSYDLFFANVRVGSHWLVFLRFCAYMPWLTYQIVKANIHVAALALHPNPPIDPQIIRFKTKLKTDISLVTFANSITLTPGTITMDIIEGEFYVHALDRKVMKDLGTGEMEDRVAHIFMGADHTNIKDG